MKDRSMKNPNGKHPNTQQPPRDYAVGYGKPPLFARFRKGVSGNPRGRPRGMTDAGAKALALKELYRLVTVREGDKVMRLPVIQAVLRSQLALAVKGHSPAQRAVIAAAHALEQDVALEAAAAREKAAAAKPTSYLDAARRVAFLLRLAYDEMGQPTMPGTIQDAIEGLLRHDPSAAREVSKGEA
jgi:hypothetical protein